jgi:hypothetical protein
MIDHDDYDTAARTDEQRYQAEFLRHATVTAPEDYAYAANGSGKTQHPPVVVEVPSGQILSPDAAAQSQVVAYEEAATMVQLQSNHDIAMTSPIPQSQCCNIHNIGVVIPMVVVVVICVVPSLLSIS